MEEQLVSFETAKLAKEKGFREGNHRYRCSNDMFSYIYDEDGFNPEVYLISPTQSLLQKWLREVHNIDIEPEKFKDGGKDGYLLFIYSYLGRRQYYTKESTSLFKTYEGALEIGLQESLKLIK